MPRVLFNNEDVFDYDVFASDRSIFVVAVLETSLMVAKLSLDDDSEQHILVDGIPANLEVFSPALHISDKNDVITLATLTMNPSHVGVSSTLFYGVLNPRKAQ